VSETINELLTVWRSESGSIGVLLALAILAPPSLVFDDRRELCKGLEPRCTLDQRLLHIVGSAADMSGKLVTRGGQKLALSGAPIEAREKLMLSTVWAEASPNPFPWRVYCVS
jgi:hypothetical protein